MTLLEASHLRRSYDETLAVDDVSFSVGAGEIFGLLGPNGAGKTTTMMMLAGLLKPDSGSVTIGGRTLKSDGRALRFELGVVPQDLAIYPELSARENLAFFGRLYALGGKRLTRRVDAVLDLTGLEPHADQLVNTFSGGMKRRLNFGVGLLHEPKLLILDEPTVGVDPQSRSHLLDRVRDLSSGGMAVLYASHYMEEVQALCDRVAIMDHGRIIACDTLEGLLRQVRGRVELEIAEPAPGMAARLGSMAELESTSNGHARVVIQDQPDGDSGAIGHVLAKVVAILNEEKVEVLSVETQESNLERLFLELTGHQLRD